MEIPDELTDEITENTTDTQKLIEILFLQQIIPPKMNKSAGFNIFLKFHDRYKLKQLIHYFTQCFTEGVVFCVSIKELTEKNFFGYSTGDKIKLDSYLNKIICNKELTTDENKQRPTFILDDISDMKDRGKKISDFFENLIINHSVFKATDKIKMNHQNIYCRFIFLYDGAYASSCLSINDRILNSFDVKLSLTERQMEIPKIKEMCETLSDIYPMTADCEGIEPVFTSINKEYIEFVNNLKEMTRNNLTNMVMVKEEMERVYNYTDNEWMLLKKLSYAVAKRDEKKEVEMTHIKQALILFNFIHNITAESFGWTAEDENKKRMGYNWKYEEKQF